MPFFGLFADLSQTPSLSAGRVVSATISLPANEASAFTLVVDSEVRGDHRMAESTLSRKPSVLARLRSALTTFADHVYSVVGMCAQEKMCWVDAQAVISSGAIMADQKTIRYRSVMQDPRESMSLSMVESAIAIWRWAAEPKPATIGLLDESPKSSFYDFCFVQVGNMAWARTKVTLIELKHTAQSIKHFAAVQAGRWDVIVGLHRRDLISLGATGPGLFAQLAAPFILSQGGVI